jgi:transcriptional regulator GlxA family with amidase domain
LLEGLSFQRVLEEARHQLARHYLNNSVLELNEAAYLLGYEDANSFVRAFRTWEGIPLVNPSDDGRGGFRAPTYGAHQPAQGAIGL